MGVFFPWVISKPSQWDTQYGVSPVSSLDSTESPVLSTPGLDGNAPHACVLRCLAVYSGTPQMTELMNQMEAIWGD